MSVDTLSKRSLKREWFEGTFALALTALACAAAHFLHPKVHAIDHGLFWTSVAIVVIAGTVAVRRIASACGRSLARHSSLAAGANLRLVFTAIGYVLLLIVLFTTLGVSLQKILIGAGLIGVILGIAAQQSLGNIFAALVLLFARPFAVGDTIRIRSGVVGVVDATVLATGLTYVSVKTDDGLLKIPNAIMLGAGIGHLDPAPKKTSKKK